ncbi:DNA binding domain-containing protein, excisionase family, partial [Ectothiorhodospira magna]
MSTGKAAKRLGVSVKTLQRWDREGRLIPAA